MNGIHEFVIRGGQTVTAGQMDAFRRKLPFLKVKAEIIGRAGTSASEDRKPISSCGMRKTC